MEGGEALRDGLGNRIGEIKRGARNRFCATRSATGSANMMLGQIVQTDKHGNLVGTGTPLVRLLR